ncbi:MAG: hypothetical protein P1V36_01710 [Planctomycetota bacterium]|nr:hypothetical protein [Planctomycetota bacterium]
MNKPDLTDIPTVDHDEADNLIVDMLDYYAAAVARGVGTTRGLTIAAAEVEAARVIMQALVARSYLLDEMLAASEPAPTKSLDPDLRERMAGLAAKLEGLLEPEDKPKVEAPRPDWLPVGWRIVRGGPNWADRDAKVGDVIVAVDSFSCAVYLGRVRSVGASYNLDPVSNGFGTTANALSGLAHSFTYYTVERDWIPWTGESPQPTAARVIVRFRDGGETSEPRASSNYRWSHLSDGVDIVAYKIAD